MAKYEESISIAFNANDGKLSYIVNPETASDIARHYKMFGKWRARWMFLKAFWKGLKVLEKHAKLRPNKNVNDQE